MSDTIMSILMLTGVLLTGGAVIVFRKGDRRRARRMVVAARGVFAKVAILGVAGKK